MHEDDLDWLYDPPAPQTFKELIFRCWRLFLFFLAFIATLLALVMLAALSS